jgi:hypothetical protein
MEGSSDKLVEYSMPLTKLKTFEVAVGGAEPSEALNRSSTKPLSIEALFFFCFRAGDTFPADADPVIGDASDVFTDVVTAADEPKVGSAGAGPNVESPEAAADPSDRATGPKVGAGTSVLVVAGVAVAPKVKGLLTIPWRNQW